MRSLTLASLVIIAVTGVDAKPRGQLRGHVFSAESGLPIQNLRVELLSRDCGSDGTGPTAKSVAPISTFDLTAADGVFAVELPAGCYCARFTGDDAMPLLVDRISVAPSNTTSIDLPIRTGPVLQLRVVDAQTGEGIRAAEVSAGAHAPPALTDSLGTVQSGGLRPGWNRLSVKASSYLDQSIEVWATSTEQPAQMLVRLQRPGAIEGRFGTADSAFAGATVFACGETQASECVATIIDPSGQFTIAGLRPQRYCLTAIPQASGQSEREPESSALQGTKSIALGTVEVRPGQVSQLPTVLESVMAKSAETPAPPNWSGSVIDLGGFPVGGARLVAWSEENEQGSRVASVAESDAAGQFSFSLGGPSPWTVQASANAFVPQIMTLKAGMKRQRSIVMERALSLTVRVTDSCGFPIEGARVTSRRDLEYGLPIKYSTDQDGVAVLDNLEAGLVEWVVVAPGYAPAITSTLVDRDSSSRLHQLALRTGQSLRVIVQDKQGEPMMGAALTYLAPTNGPNLVALLKLPGLIIPALESGDYWLGVAVQGQTVRRRITITNRAETIVVEVERR